jgi:hypothetical protein
MRSRCIPKEQMPADCQDRIREITDKVSSFSVLIGAPPLNLVGT